MSENVEKVDSIEESKKRPINYIKNFNDWNKLSLETLIHIEDLIYYDLLKE